MDAGAISARLNTFRVPGKTVRTLVQFLSEGGSPRTFSLVGAPMRVTFDPPMTAAMREFALRGLTVLQKTGDWLLFAICLALPRRTAAHVRRATTALLVAEVATLIAGAALGFPSELRMFLGLAAASTLIVVSLHAAVGSSGAWLWRLAVVAGVVLGLGAGQQFHENVAFAGDHPLLGFALFAAIIAGAQLWAVGLVRAAGSLAYRAGLSERLATIAMAVIVCHFASHWMMERGAGGSNAAVLTAAWAVALVVVALVSRGASGGDQATALRRPESRTT
jgi:hypothetical protein